VLGIVTEEYILFGLLVFFRIGALLMTMPIFGEVEVPLVIKTLVCVAISLSFVLNVDESHVFSQPIDLFYMAFLAIKEIIIGCAFGFLARILFDGFLMAASLVGYQMGFGTSNIILPGSTDEQTAFSTFHRAVVILVLLGMGFHRHILFSFAEIFRFVPVGRGIDLSRLYDAVLYSGSKIFVIAMQIASPIVVAVLFTTAALGLLSRSVPQLNVFTLSFPFCFFVGISVYVASLYLYPTWITSNMFSNIDEIFVLFSLAKA
jgi:flagellar biosynthetic protein FliR